MIRYTNYILSVFCGFLLVACGTTKVLNKVSRKKTMELTARLDSISKNIPNTFYAKISTEFKDTNQQLSFKTSIRLVKDSAMTALVTYLGIPVVNSLVTKDTLAFTLKKERCYVKTDVSLLRQKFGVDFSFRNLEELIYGLPIDFDTKAKYHQFMDPYFHVLSTHKKRKIKRLGRKGTDDYVIKYFFTDDSLGIKKIELFNPADSTHIFVEYLKKKIHDGFALPKEIEMRILTAKNNVFILLDYDRIEINQPQEIYFTIPENYEHCQ